MNAEEREVLERWRARKHAQPVKSDGGIDWVSIVLALVGLALIGAVVAVLLSFMACYGTGFITFESWRMVVH